MRKRQPGMTLVELMVVVLIIAILAGIAVPSYRSYMLRANRSEAKTALMSNAGALERCYTRYNDYRYVAAPADGCKVQFPVPSENGLYSISATVWQKSSFTLTAVPQGGQTQDTGCGNLTLDSANTRGRSGTKSISECWGR